VATLTIVCHPELERIGQRALLLALDAGHEVALSRTAPEFASPGSVWGTALEDPYLSRSPLILRPAQRVGVELDAGASTTTLEADGEPVVETRTFTRRELEHGVVLELASRIVLLLHLLHAPTPGTRVRGEMVGDSEGIEQVRTSIERVADLKVPVLLRGESGTGKELAARAIHDAGPRRDHPFVAVNLGAVPPSLAASELFGSVKGAFTGAVSSQQGYFRAAQGGTLCLDEVGEAPPELQVMLLRALETGEIFPVGSQQPRKVELRVVAATDSDLEARVRAGNFKAPLLHRLSAYEIWLPPLRQRRDDLGRLFLHFAARELAAVGQAGFLDEAPREPPWLSADLAARLARYDWPGNVRQLRNVVRQLVIDGRGQPQLHAGTRVERLLSQPPELKQRPAEAAATPAPRTPADIAHAELEATLDACRYNLATAARQLGISRPSLYNLIRDHPTLRTAAEIPSEELAQALDAASGDLVVAARRLRISTAALRRQLARRAPDSRHAPGGPDRIEQ
ncbi:MAG: sigma-54 dependent transcriptional regulator, partial [Acidobacteriota bacterium]